MHKIGITLLLGILLLGIQNAAAQKRLPEITVQDVNGAKVNIADYGRNNKITVISFWAIWCTPCKKELNNIKELYANWQEEYGVELIALSIDDARNSAKVKSYANGQAWDYIILLDKNQELKRSLNFQTIPYTLLINQAGEIVYQHSSYVEGDEYILEDEIKALVK